MSEEQKLITAVRHLVRREEREARNGHKGCVAWLTGLPGSGKSTLAMGAERELFARGRSVYVLDGDNVRSGLSSDLGFSPADRVENIRRVSELAALFADAGLIVITAFISPYARDRAFARSRYPVDFHEVFVQCDRAVCEARDPKGLYAKARRSDLHDFTGVSAPYEAPRNPDLAIDTEHAGIESCVARLVDYLETHARLGSPGEDRTPVRAAQAPSP